MFLTTNTRLTIQTVSLCPELGDYENRTREYSGLTWRFKAFRKACQRYGVERIGPRKWKAIDRKWKTVYIVAFH